MDKKGLFSVRLQAALVDKYGRVPKPKQLNLDLLSRFGHIEPVSDEAVRKWITGKSIPNGTTLMCLSKLLGKDVTYWF